MTPRFQGMHPTNWSALIPRTAWLLALVVMAFAIVVPGWAMWTPILLAVAPLTAAWALRRTSILATFCAIQIAVSYGLTWPVMSGGSSPDLVALVVLWTAGLTLGAFAGRGAAVASADKAWQPPKWPHFALAAGALAVQGFLIFSGRLGIEAQLGLGSSTPIGVLGILSTAGPIIVLMLLIRSLGSQRQVPWALLLGVAQATVSALTGFRGAAVVFVIAVFVAAALTLPRSSPWRRPRRMALAAGILAIAAMGGFILGANVKDRVATELEVSSGGTVLFGWDQALPVLTQRLDLGTPLRKAIEIRDDSTAKQAVSWVNQVQAFVPRVLWPEKPVIDYGRQVSVTIYGRPPRTSSTITAIGDTLVNFAIPGVAIVSILIGFLMSRAERIIRSGAGLLSLVLAACLSYGFVGLEAPVILTMAGLIRNMLVASVLGFAAEAVYRLFNRDGSIHADLNSSLRTNTPQVLDSQRS